MRSLFLIPTAGVSFFFCAWLAMIFWGIVSPDLGIQTIGYPKAMLVTIAVWLVITPLIAAISKRQK
jgi:hypothetical protein